MQRSEIMQLSVVNTLGRRLPVGSRSAAVLAELLVGGSAADGPAAGLRARLEAALTADADLLAWVAERASAERISIDAADNRAAADWLLAQPVGAFVDVFTIDATGEDEPSDEQSSLATCLPDLAKRLARLDDLEHRFDETLEAEKLEAMAELAAGAGHEINNPLAVISGRAQLFLRQEDDPERRRAFASMNTQVGRVFEMISDLMLYARPPEPQTEEIDLVEVNLRGAAGGAERLGLDSRSEWCGHQPGGQF
jgi:signal transduction histidine kinase